MGNLTLTMGETVRWRNEVGVVVSDVGLRKVWIVRGDGEDVFVDRGEIAHETPDGETVMVDR